MSLAEYYRPGRVGLSFELFPPKADGMEALWQSIDELNAFNPDYFTCTYGAGGSTRERTMEIVTEVKRRWGRPVASHLTCVGSTVEQLREYLSEAQRRGVDYIVALRGDPPKGETSFQAVAGGLRYANELVQLIRGEFADYGIAVAGYPEVHQEAPDADIDLTNLKRKVDAGADVIVTQLFYDNDDFYRFRDRCEAAGITIPIIPGLLPIISFAQIRRITSLCKAKLPSVLVERLSAQEDPQWHFEVGVEHARQQVADLVAHEVPGLHFYVLNKAQATREILNALPTFSSATA